MKKGLLLNLLFSILSTFVFQIHASNEIPELVTRNDVGYQGPNKETIMSLPLVATLSPSGNGTQDVNNLQTAVNEASQQGGGRIVITAGVYQLSSIVLKSNVHLLFNAGVEVTPLLNGNMRQDIFLIGKNDGEDIENVTFIGEGDKETRPLFRYDRTIGASARLFNCGRIVNLYVSNINISDEQTKFSAITFHPQKNGTTKDDIAKNITIMDVSMTDASYGYGLVQGNVGENMWLKNLEVSGGVAARMETHTGREQNLGVYNVVIEDVKCYQGKAAVTMQPHVVENGIVTVNGAYAENSEWCVMIKDGFVSNKLDPNIEWEIGSWAPGSRVENVHLVHCDSTTVAFQHEDYIPNSLYYLYKPNSKPDKEDGTGRVGPSIAAVANFAHDEVVIVEPTITHSGPRASERLLIVTEAVDRTLDNSIEEAGVEDGYITINEGDGLIKFMKPCKNAKVYIFNMRGQVVKNFKASYVNEIRFSINNVPNGKYLAVVDADGIKKVYRFLAL